MFVESHICINCYAKLCHVFTGKFVDPNRNSLEIESNQLESNSWLNLAD